MSAFIRVLFVECRRAFASPRFFMAAALVCLTLFFGSWQDLSRGGGSVAYYYTVAMSEPFYLLFILFCALPHATSFCTDWRSQFIKPYVARTSLPHYQHAKIVSCAASGFFVVLLGQSFFIGILSVFLPITLPEFLSAADANPVFMPLLAQGHTVVYFAALLITRSLCGAVFSVLALFVSTILPNLFVVVATPMLLYYGTVNLAALLGLPPWLRLNRIYASQYDMGSPASTFLYGVFFSCAITVLLGTAFSAGLKRRLKCG